MVLPSEILQAEHQLNWYAEFGEATLRIYLDGRSPPADPDPSYYGYTTGAWQGNVLVTKTTGLRADTLIDTTGVPHSDRLTVTMRMQKVTPDYLEIAVTLDDPVAFERPWSTVKRYARAPAHYYVQEYACREGNRYRIGAEGNVEVVTEPDTAAEGRYEHAGLVNRITGGKVWGTRGIAILGTAVAAALAAARRGTESRAERGARRDRRHGRAARGVAAGHADLGGRIHRRDRWRCKASRRSRTLRTSHRISTSRARAAAAT